MKGKPRTVAFRVCSSCTTSTSVPGCASSRGTTARRNESCPGRASRPRCPQSRRDPGRDQGPRVAAGCSCPAPRAPASGSPQLQPDQVARDLVVVGLAGDDFLAGVAALGEADGREQARLERRDLVAQARGPTAAGRLRCEARRRSRRRAAAWRQPGRRARGGGPAARRSATTGRAPADRRDAWDGCAGQRCSRASRTAASSATLPGGRFQKGAALADRTGQAVPSPPIRSATSTWSCQKIMLFR